MIWSVVPVRAWPPKTSTRRPATAISSESGCGSLPASRTFPVRGLTATIESLGVFNSGPRPPITRAYPPVDTAAACVVGTGS